MSSTRPSMNTKELGRPGAMGCCLTQNLLEKHIMALSFWLYILCKLTPEYGILRLLLPTRQRFVFLTIADNIAIRKREAPWRWLCMDSLESTSRGFPMINPISGWCFGTMAFMTFHSVRNVIIATNIINSYFSKVWLNHQPDWIQTFLKCLVETTKKD